MTQTNEHTSAASLLQTYLRLLRFGSTNGTSTSRPLNPWRITLRNMFPDTNLHSLSNVSQILAPHYLRVMFVRHPFARLASAYKERIAILAKDRVEPELYYDSIRRSICRRYTRFKSVKASTQKQDPCKDFIPPFEHFVRYILMGTGTPAGVARMDAHWQPYSIVCQVCKFNYNFIGKYETFTEDFTSLVQHLNATDWNIQKRIGASGYTTSDYQQLFASLPDELLCQLEHLYKDDFRLFNYRPDEYGNRTTLICSMWIGKKKNFDDTGWRVEAIICFSASQYTVDTYPSYWLTSTSRQAERSPSVLNGVRHSGRSKSQHLFIHDLFKLKNVRRSSCVRDDSKSSNANGQGWICTRRSNKEVKINIKTLPSVCWMLHNPIRHKWWLCTM